jgi:ABC-type ATPase with predicted acetyltransferase domain
MKRPKHVVETIAQMARYNPFFEKAGFKYLWDTGSGRPVLFYPLSSRAAEIIERFLSSDPYASKHGGRLYRSRIGEVEKLSGPVKMRNVSKIYSSLLDISRMPPKLQDVLRAFGVERRLVEKYVLRNVELEIMPGEVVAVVGASGAGKTTFLRMIIGASLGMEDQQYRPSMGVVEAPPNTRIGAYLPGEMEPRFGDETLLEHVYSKIGDEAAAVEVLSMVGLSDAVFYRARFSELSTGQKERARLASILAEKPNLVVIDEFAAHLDPLTAQRVARKLGILARRIGATLIVSTNRREILRALAPDSIVFVGYGAAHKIEGGGSGGQGD